MVRQPSATIKKSGFKSLAEFAAFIDTNPQWIRSTYKNRPRLFEVVMAGAVYLKENSGGFR